MRYFVLFFGIVFLMSCGASLPEMTTMSLLTLEEEFTVIEEGMEYCGCPLKGLKEYSGKYKLSFKGVEMNLGALSFCDETKHMRRVYTKRQDSGVMYYIYQYGTCNGDDIHAFGFDKKTKEIFQYEFFWTPDNIQKTLLCSDFDFDEDGDLVSRFYNNMEGKDYTRKWEIDEKGRQIKYLGDKD